MPRPKDPAADDPALDARAIKVRMGEFEATTAWLRGKSDRILLRQEVGLLTGGPDTTGTVTHPRGDGQVSFRETVGARSIELSGLIMHDKAGHGTGTLRTTIETVKAATRSGTLYIEEHDRSMMREIDVRRTDFISTQLSNAAATYSLRFVADDPLLYGSAVRTLTRNTAVGVRNPGDAARTYPILEWTGAAANPGVDFGTLSWRLGQNTAAGDRMLVNCREGTVFRNGSQIFPNWTGFWPYTSSASAFQFTAIGTNMTMRRAAGWS